MRKRSFIPRLAFLLCFAPALAGAGTDSLSRVEAEEKTPVDLFKIEGHYVFESQIKDDENDSLDLGKADAFEFELEYAHRFHLNGHWYLRVGVNYNRFNFGETAAPIPSHLHSLAAVISLDYMVGADQGMFLEFRPGFYAEDHFNSDSFDCPITLARAWVLVPEKVYLLTGVNVAFLRGELPVLPIGGIIWRIDDKRWVLYAVPPEPRLIWMPNEKWDFWVGGQITGGSFRTEHDDNIVPHKLSGAQIDYIDYRAGAGMSWHPTDAVEFNVGGGVSIQRRFDYERADVRFNSDAAPYVRAWVRVQL